MRLPRSLTIIFSFALSMFLASCAVNKNTSAGASDLVPLETTTNLSSTPIFEVYCDFRCPFCARFFITLLTGARYLGKEPVYVFKHYPFHSGSETLASFYEAAILNNSTERDGLIESLYRFRSQSEPNKINLLIPALSIAHGFDLQLIKRDMEARDVMLTVSESKRAAVALGVTKTPTVFHQGKELTLTEPEELARFILENSPLRNAETRSLSVGDCPSCEASRSSK